jgi:hypothetical protein
MKRVAWILTVLGILCLAAGQAQAHDGRYYGGHHGGYHGVYHGGFYGPVVVRPQVWVGPRVLVPVAPPPVVAYPPAYRYRCYEPIPSGGFYYRGRGLSIGVGW